jgi:hypothetical protein
MSRTDNVGLVGLGSSGLRIRQSDGAKVNTIPFPVARVWALLPSVFDSLAIPLTDLDQAKRTLGNGGMKLHKTLGKAPLSSLIDCGNSQGFASADSYDIHMTITTQVVAAENGGTVIGTMVEAAGKPMAFPGSYSKCTTKETLENSIVAILTAKLSR